jgi:hypothetical protein
LGECLLCLLEQGADAFLGYPGCLSGGHCGLPFSLGLGAGRVL